MLSDVKVGDLLIVTKDNGTVFLERVTGVAVHTKNVMTPHFTFNKAGVEMDRTKGKGRMFLLDGKAVPFSEEKARELGIDEEVIQKEKKRYSHFIRKKLETNYNNLSLEQLRDFYCLLTNNS